MVDNTKEKLIILKELVEYADKNGLKKEFYEQLLKELLNINNSSSLIKYDVSEIGMKTAYFNPDMEKISISVKKMNTWLDINIKYLKELYGRIDDEIFKIYLSLFVIDHEIEHSTQYLIGEGAILAPNELIKTGYKGIFDLFRQEYTMIPRPLKDARKHISLLLYRLKQNFYLIERNANVESSKLLKELAIYMQKEDVFRVFYDFEISFSKIGYIKNNIGSLEETYRKILMYDKYKKYYKDLNISEDEKIRYGLNISEESRTKILEMKTSLIK